MHRYISSLSKQCSLEDKHSKIEHSFARYINTYYKYINIYIYTCIYIYIYLYIYTCTYAVCSINCHEAIMAIAKRACFKIIVRVYICALNIAIETFTLLTTSVFQKEALTRKTVTWSITCRCRMQKSNVYIGNQYLTVNEFNISKFPALQHATVLKMSFFLRICRGFF